MPEYLAPGVYVEEIDTGSKPIEGVSTSTAGMVGVAERGPVNVPILITSFGEFARWFGGHLNVENFPDDDFQRPFRYLSHAVEGFFTNGGKRVFVTRVLPPDATPASLDLYDRGSAPASAVTHLLRPAAQATGSAIRPPLLYLLDPANLAAQDRVRIGEGSRAEYREVVNIGTAANSTHVPLGFPSSYAHEIGATVNHILRVVDPAYGAVFALSQDAAAGSRLLTIAGAPADIAILVATAAPQLLEIGTLPGGEYRFATEATDLGPDPNNAARNLARVRLDSDLRTAYEESAPATPISIPAAPVQSAHLTIPSHAGDQLIFVDDRNGQFNVVADLVAIDPGVAERQEVRRIGELSELAVARGAYEAYPAGTLIEQVVMGDDNRLIVAPAPVVGARVINLNDVTGLAAGQEVVVTGGGNSDTAIIDAVDGANDTITFRPPLTHGYAVNDQVTLTARRLAAAVQAGEITLTLNNRLGLVSGDVLRIGTAPDEEFVTIRSVPGDRGTAPDSGRVVLSRPVRVGHNDDAEVRRQNREEGGHQRAWTVLAAREGAERIVVNDGHGYVAGEFIRATTPSQDVHLHRLAANATALAPVEVEIDAALIRNHGLGSPVVERRPLLSVQALDAGRWGNRLRIAVADEANGLASRAQIAQVNTPTQIRLTTLTGIEPGTIVEILGPQPTDVAVDRPVKVRSVDRTNNNADLEAPGLSGGQIAAHNIAAGTGLMLRVRSREFSLSIFLMRPPDSAVLSRNNLVQDSEAFRHLSLDPRHSRYVEKIIGTTWTPGAATDDANPSQPLRLEDQRSEGESRYIRVYDLGKDAAGPGQPGATLAGIRPGPEPLEDLLPDGRAVPARRGLGEFPDTAGDDSLGTMVDDVYIGTDDDEPLNRTGLFTLRNEEDISIVSIPGRTSQAIQNALISHCEFMRYRFAVLDAYRTPHDSLNDVQTQRQQFDTKYAALYHPWPLIPDPFPANPGEVADYPIPPSGHVIGIYARTDIERGVHKAPANEVVRGVIGLQRLLNKGEHDILNPYPVNINVIRDFRPNNRGIRVWGGRVITSDPDWKYVNVRRLLIFIEASLDRGLQWVVFEPNAEPLWARVHRTVSNFLSGVWRDGALEGTKPEEAYFVKVDRTTMTQADIDNGKLIVVIGVAPVKPAEFVIIRIGLWTAHADS